MMACCQNSIGFKRLVLNKQSCALAKQVILDCARLAFVFAVAQDCKNLLKMVSNSNRLFSHGFRKTKNQQRYISVSC